MPLISINVTLSNGNYEFVPSSVDVNSVMESIICGFVDTVITMPKFLSSVTNSFSLTFSLILNHTHHLLSANTMNIQMQEMVLILPTSSKTTKFTRKCS